ncbi:MAG: hypothetical protein HOP28_05895 [Gemmatimonadales bacterium]|nr:hypothetical protein [Gemmatimonadales bacterium]
MSLLTPRRLLAALATMTALVIALGAGFVAGRKLPHGLRDRLLGRQPAALAAWTPLDPAPLVRFEAATIVLEGRGYLFGGFGNADLDGSPEVWMYDPKDNSWTRRKDMPNGLTHANPAMAGGVVWFAGGFVGTTDWDITAEVKGYDWREDRWSSGPPLPSPRTGGALVSHAGRLHYFGGYKDRGYTNADDHWILNIADSTKGHTWVRAAPLPVPRGHLSGAAAGGYIYAIGGCRGHDPDPVDVPWVHRYDPATDKWTEVASLPSPRSHTEPATLVRNGRIVIIGGRSRPTGREAVDDVTEYDPATDRWTALPPLPEVRHSPIAFLFDDEIVVGLGGSRTSDPDTRTVWRENRSASWQPGPKLPVELGEVSAGVVGNRLYLLGERADWTLSLDLGTGRWNEPSRHAVRPAPGNHHPAESWGGRLYLFGGLGRGAGAVQIFDPAVDAWRLGPAMPFAAGAGASALIGSHIYVAGGIVGDTTTRQAARFDPAT